MFRFQNLEGLVEDEPGYNRIGFSVYASDNYKTAKTLVLVGCSGNGKSATGNSIVGRGACESKVRAAAVTKECELRVAKVPNGQIVKVIDTPGLFSLFPSNGSTIREILKCFQLSKEGIHALLMVFSLRNRLTEEEKSAIFVLKILFGSDIMDYMIVVFTNEDLLGDHNMTMKDYLEGCPDFKEILDACDNRMVLFDNRGKATKRKNAKQVQELHDLVEKVARNNNNKPFMVDLSHDRKENEAAFEEKQKKIKALKGRCTKQDMSSMKEKAEDSPHHQLSQMVEKVETKLIETASWLEKKLTEEQTARLEAEKSAKKLHQESSDEIKRLTAKLEKAEKELEKKGESCIIL